jgi:hypothetical protein
MMSSNGVDDIEAKAELTLKLGWCLNNDGRTSEAVVWLLQSCGWRERDLAEDDPDRLLL